MATLAHLQTAEEADSIAIKEINGIRIAILAYTYGTNGINQPKNREYMVNYLKQANIISDIQRANKIADFIIVCMHWGDEYALRENKSQIKFARQMHGAGANLVIGHHPHVTQGYKNILYKGRDGDENKGVVYSLGNFISGQTQAHTSDGYVLVAIIRKDNEKARASLDKFEIIPIKMSRPIVKGHRSYLVEAVSL